jgi:hypothetical protein
VPALLPRDGDSGDRRRVAIEPVDPGHIKEIFDFAGNALRLGEAAGAERIDVVIDIAPNALVGAAQRL